MTPVHPATLLERTFDPSTVTIPGLRKNITDRNGNPIELRPYQLRDIAYHCLNPRAINAEYTGAGKKLIAIATCLKLMSLGRLTSVCIISLGVDVEQWVNDLYQAVHSDFEIQMYKGSPAKRKAMRTVNPHFRVMSYQTAAADAWELLGLHDGVVLDEISYLKNPDTNAHCHVSLICAAGAIDQNSSIERIHRLKELKLVEARKIAQPRPYAGPKFTEGQFPGPKLCLSLSATPVETSPMDIFSLLLVQLGHRSPLGTNAEAFKHEMCVIQRFRGSVITRSGRKFPKVFERVKGVKPNRVKTMRSLVAPFYIRHPWDQVAPFMPEIDVQPDWVEFGSRQRERYKEIAEGQVILDYVKEENGKSISIQQVTAAIKQFYMLRCCDGLQSLPNQKQKDSVKLDRIMWWLKGEMAGEKVIVFSRFHQPLDELTAKLNLEGIAHRRIDGIHRDSATFDSLEDENEEARKAFWDDPEVLVLMITGKGMYALNLQVARYMLLFNTPFNPKKLIQLYGRIRRQGQQFACVVRHIVVKDTIEEAQWLILRDRESMADDMGLGEDTNLFTALTPAEQDKLVSYGLGSS